MDIRKLATFVDLADTLNYTETASRLFTTQATISKQIKSLEVALDTVFSRSLPSRDHADGSRRAGVALCPANCRRAKGNVRATS